MTNDITQCATYKAESANVKAKPYCKPPTGYLRARQAGAATKNLALNKEDCEVSIKRPCKNSILGGCHLFKRQVFTRILHASRWAAKCMK